MGGGGGGADAGMFAAATTSERQSEFAALVRWSVFDPCVRNDDGILNDVTSHRSPFEVPGPGGVESPWKILPAGTSSVPFSTSAPSGNVCPSETTRSRDAAPDPGY